MRYGIQSIPAVKLFVDGEVKDEFIGALPERQVRDWLQQAIPSEASGLIAGARAAFDAGEAEDAEALLEKALALAPANPEAALLLAKLILFKDPARAEQLSHTPGADFAAAEAISSLSRLLQDGAESDLPESPARDAYLEAITTLRTGDLDTALAGLVDSVRKERHYQDDLARRTLLSLFTILGDRHELTKKHRRALEMALF
jgi:putative thioredoxin